MTLQTFPSRRSIAAAHPTPSAPGLGSRASSWLRAHNPWLVLVTMASANLAAYTGAWVYSNGLQFGYADVATHLNLARRVFDSATPGLGQLGAYWLPLVHVAELPFVWSDFLWKSGLAGTIVSMAAYVGAVYFTFRLCHELTRRNDAALLGAAVVALNPNYLYLSTLPMFEGLLLCTWIAAVFYAVRWADRDRTVDLIQCAFWTMLATLVRHDNWALLPGAIWLIVVTTLWIRRQGRARLESNLIIYGVLALFGVALSLLWNQISYGDPLWFLHPSHSARSVPETLEAASARSGRYALADLLAFPIAAYNSLGGLIVALGLVGLCDFVLNEERTPVMWAGLIALTPFAFFTAMVVQQGSSWILTQQFDGQEFNQRYGLDLLPAAGIFIAFLARRRLPVKLAVGLLVLIQPAVMIATQRVQAHTEPTEAAYRADNLLHIEAGMFLRDHYRGGQVLMSTFDGGDVVILNSGLNNREFITESNQGLWAAALARPEQVAWVIAREGGRTRSFPVAQRINSSRTFAARFVAVYSNDKYSIYVRRDVAAEWGLYTPPDEPPVSRKR